MTKYNAQDAKLTDSERLVESAVDRWMREAEKTKELQNNPFKGKPLDFDDYFKSPEELRAGYRVLKNAGVLPPKLELKKLINEKRELLKTLSDSSKIEALKKEIFELELKMNVLK